MMKKQSLPIGAVVDIIILAAVSIAVCYEVFLRLPFKTAHFTRIRIGNIKLLTCGL